ncbi:MAG: carboxypeptidase-like regulatory domain-containing protein [Cytophagales bacterium]|nr:carboxypeptidase-like regulatory domain-containing protein [Cytophagales bacterium]
MRKLFLGLLLFALLDFTYGQAITYQAENVPLTQVFADLETKYELYFSYADNDVALVHVSVDANEQPIDEFLHTLLVTRQFNYEEVEKGFYSIIKTQSISLDIQINDVESGEELPFATARVVGTTQGFIGDLFGGFDVTIENPESTQLEFSFVGYEAQVIDLGAVDPTQTLNIQLEKDVRELDGVVIREYLNKGVTTDDRASSIAIDVQEMEILPGLSERDVLLSAQILAGVGSADESASGINIRGSASNNSLIYWNNIPVYQAAHYFGNISSFIPSVVGQMEVYKNHIPLNYGGSTAGLLLLDSRQGSGDWIGETSLNLTHADFYTNVPLLDGDMHVTLAGRRSYNDLLATFTFNSLSNKIFEGSQTEDIQQDITEDQFEYNSKLIFSDLNLIIDYELSSKEELSFSALYSQSQLDYFSESEEGEREASQVHNVNSRGANLTWTRRWHDRFSSVFSTSITDYHMDYGLQREEPNEGEEEEEEEEAGLEPVNNRETRSNGLENWESRFTLNYNPVGQHYLKAGYQFNRVNAALVIDEQLSIEEDYFERNTATGFTQGLFLDYFGKLDNGLQLGAGVRQNWTSTVPGSKLDRHVRLNYAINDDWLIKSSWGFYHQYITSLQEVDFVFSNTIEQNWVIASEDADVPIIRNDQWVLGFLMDKGNWLFDLDLFTKDVDAPISRNFGPAVNDQDGDPLVLGSERITGLDLMVKRRWKYYKAWLSYSFQDSEVSVEIDDEEEVNFTSGINLRHQFQLSQTFQWQDWEFSMGYTRKSGLPYTEPLRAVFVEEEDDESYYEIEYQSVNSRRLKDYERIDLSLWYKFAQNNKLPFKGEVGFSVLNVLNRENLYSRLFSVDISDENTDQVVISRIDRRLIGITPNLSVRLIW